MVTHTYMGVLWIRKKEWGHFLWINVKWFLGCFSNDQQEVSATGACGDGEVVAVSSQAATVTAWVGWSGGPHWTLSTTHDSSQAPGSNCRISEFSWPKTDSSPSHVGVQTCGLGHSWPLPRAFPLHSLSQFWAYCHNISVTADSDSISDCQKVLEKSALLLLYTQAVW